MLVDGQSIGAVDAYTFEGVSEIHTIEVTFQKITFTVIATAGQGGEITPSGEITLEYGQDQHFVITPNQGYKVKKLWSNGDDMGAPLTYAIINIQENYTVTVEFEKITHTITASAVSNGSISPNGEVSVEYGNDKTFAITPNTGYKVKDVLVDGQSVGKVNSYTFESIDNNHTISVSFEKIEFTIVASCTSGGTISPSGETTAQYGDSKVYTITPNVGYQIASIKLNQQNQTVLTPKQATQFTIENITENKTIEVTFEKIKYTIGVICGENGTITPQTQQVEHGATITFIITPNVNANLVDVLVDGQSQGIIYTYTFENVTSDHTIEATFAEKTEFKITINCDQNGNITPNDITNIEKGTSQTFTLSPNDGFVVKEVRVNGIRVLVENNQFTVENIQSDMIIEVSFEKQAQQGDITTLIIIFAAIVLSVAGVVMYFVIKSTKIKKLEK